MTQLNLPPARSASEILRVILSGRMLVACLMGFSSGLPLLLTGSVLQAWMTKEGVDLGTIGLFALVGLPYTLKFLWAPLLDRYTLIAFMGRRRGWLLVIQLLLALAIAGLGFTQPAISPFLVACAAFMVTFFSASQDIVIDAYRRESLADDEQGLGAALYVNGYRVGILLASGGGLIMADFLPFSTVFLIMAGAMIAGIVTTLFATEPEVTAGTPKTLYYAVVQPFTDYFSRQDSVWILLFILLYKVGDTMAAHITTPFYLEIGFTMTEIGTVVKLFGFWATIIGGFVGGVLILRWGIYKSLWYFGIFQMLTTLGFAALARVGDEVTALALVIAGENLAGGMGTSAYIAFMASLTNKKFTATQYALLSSLMGIPRVILASPTGYMAESMGWEGFFIFCTLVAIPGLWLLTRFRGWMVQETPLIEPVLQKAEGS